jgi:hypothetical protein
MFDGSRVVFINFAVGSFGSFLWHTLAQSKTSYDKSTLENTFDEHGAAHNNVAMNLRHFHSREDITKWRELDSDARKKAIENNWKDPVYWDKSNKVYVHRVTTPQYSSEILKACPTAKLIIIDFDKDDVPLIASMLAKKVIIPNQFNQGIIPKPNQLNQGIIPNETLVKEMTTTMVMKSLPEKNVEGAYYFKFKYFLNDSFIDEFNKLCKWLNFDVPDITEWYNTFKRVNNL